MAAYSFPESPQTLEQSSPQPYFSATADTADLNRRRRMSLVAMLATLVGCAFLFFSRAESIPAVNALLAIAVILVCAAPTVIYLRKEEPDPLPMLPLIGAFYIVAFALPVFSTDRAIFVMLRPEIVTPASLLIVLGGILLLYGGYWISKHLLFVNTRPLSLPTEFQNGWLCFLLWMLLIPHLMLFWVPAFRNAPSVQSLLEPAGYVAYGMFFLMWARGHLSRKQALALVAICVPLELAGRFATGALLQIVLFAVFGLAMYWYQNHKVPWITITAMVLFFVLLQPVKDAFRRYTWVNGRFASLSISGKVALFGEMAWRYYTQPHGDQAFLDAAAGRVAHIRLLAFVMDQSPSPIPYWDGETYKPLLTKFIPRFLWPGKPQETLSHEFGHRYNLINDNDHVTAMNLPWLVELWVNFGMIGWIAGMLLYGMLFGFLAQKLNSPHMTVLEFALGATVLFPLCVNQESHFSVVAGNAFLVVLCLYAYFQIGYLLQPRRAAFPMEQQI